MCLSILELIENTNLFILNNLHCFSLYSTSFYIYFFYNSNFFISSSLICNYFFSFSFYITLFFNCFISSYIFFTSSYTWSLLSNFSSFSLCWFVFHCCHAMYVANIAISGVRSAFDISIICSIHIRLNFWNLTFYIWLSLGFYYK